MRTLLGGVEVRVTLSATGAPESHSASRIVGRTMRGHPFSNASFPGRQMIEKADGCRIHIGVKPLKGNEHDDAE